jgi:hypothetical protein
VDHAIAGRLARTDRCAAGARSSLLEDTLAASTSFAGLTAPAQEPGEEGFELQAARETRRGSRARANFL